VPELDLLAVAIGTVAAFVSGATYYGVFGAQLAEVSDAGSQPPPWKLGAEVARCLLVAAVVAGLAAQAAIDDWAGGVLLGLALWIGFPLVLWTGAIIHADTPWKLAAIHAGDWLAKLVLVAVIVSVLR
jgi:Protein of unknown function (DUF1761)